MYKKAFTSVLLVWIVASSFTMLYAQDSSSGCPETTPLALVIGEQAYVLPGGANRVRSAPTTSGDILFQIESGEEFTTIGGPECGDGYRWWQVSYEGQEGWTVEGDDANYFLESVVAEIEANTPAPETEPGNADCTLEPRLVVGQEGRLTTITPSRVRDAASTSGAQLGQIQPLDTFAILEGPVCAEGINWWHISVGDLEGWTAEGLDGEYFTELVAILPTPTPDYIGIPDPTEISWNSDGSLIAVGTLHDGMFVYDTSDWSLPPRQIFEDASIWSLVFVPGQPDQVAVSLDQPTTCGEQTDRKSGLIVFDLATEEPNTIILDYTGSCAHDSVSQLQFNADGSILATLSTGHFVSYTMPDGEFDFHIGPYDFGGFPMFSTYAFSGDGSQIAFAQDTEQGNSYLSRAYYAGESLYGFEFAEADFDELVTALAITVDGNRIIVGDEVGNLRTYSRVEGSEAYTDYNSFIRGDRSPTSNRINAVALDPNTGAIVTAESGPNAVVRVFDPESLSQINGFSGDESTFAAIDLAFSPDGSMLAVIVDDTIRILDTSDYSEVATLVVQRN